MVSNTGLLSKRPILNLIQKNLEKILIISSFSEGDPIAEEMKKAIEATKSEYPNIAVDFKRVSNSSEFKDVLSNFEGNILIFDGHGEGNSKNAIGTLKLGNESYDIWELPSNIRIPPIVLLSACDTHSLDASTQATVANGFLARGAITVLATILPVGGYSSAELFARLLIRIAQCIPAVLEARKASLSWQELITGMLRMKLASETIHHFFGASEIQMQLQNEANSDINFACTPHWYDNLIARISEITQKSHSSVEQECYAILARSEAIRYVQLGHPENIIITNKEIADTALKLTKLLD